MNAVLRHAMGAPTAAAFSLVLAGDVVKAKKPAPDIYLLAAQRLGVRRPTAWWWRIPITAW